MQEIFYDFVWELARVVAVASIPVVAGFLVKLINYFSNEIKERVEYDRAEYYIDKVEDIVIDAVEFTNETFVDKLKKENAFDENKHREAFEKSKRKILSMLNDETADMIKNLYGDLDEFLEMKIERVIKELKE